MTPPIYRQSVQRRMRRLSALAGCVMLSIAAALAPAQAPAQATATDTAAAQSTRMLEKSDARKAFIEQLNNPNRKLNVGLSYWIELTRNGKSFRCNNKYKFRSGDLIKFHIVANADGYVYVVLKKGTSGSQSLLFPSQATGMDNELKLARDYSVPTKT